MRREASAVPLAGALCPGGMLELSEMVESSTNVTSKINRQLLLRRRLPTTESSPRMEICSKSTCNDLLKASLMAFCTCADGSACPSNTTEDDTTTTLTTSGAISIPAKEVDLGVVVAELNAEVKLELAVAVEVDASEANDVAEVIEVVVTETVVLVAVVDRRLVVDVAEVVEKEEEVDAEVVDVAEEEEREEEVDVVVDGQDGCNDCGCSHSSDSSLAEMLPSLLLPSTVLKRTPCT